LSRIDTRAGLLLSRLGASRPTVGMRTRTPRGGSRIEVGGSLANAMSTERFFELSKQVRAVLDAIPSPKVDETRPVREIFEARAAQLPQLREAERMLTEALAEFPLHPYLLDWRAEVRMRMMDGKATFLAIDQAVDDLEQASKVAPDYLLPKLRLADLTYVQLDDNEGAARLFGEVLEKMESLVCSCVGGQVEALADSEQREQAKSLLAHWQLVFPSSERLKMAAKHLALGA
jgi:tetratricopeptide (TPR) repeat protein